MCKVGGLHLKVLYKTYNLENLGTKLMAYLAFRQTIKYVGNMKATYTYWNRHVSGLEQSSASSN